MSEEMKDETRGASSVFPAGLLERIRTIKQVYKQTVRLIPVNQTSVVSGNKILLQFPTDSVLDMKTFSLDCYIQTAQAGNAGATAPGNYTQSYYLPRNGLASMISQIDVRVNGRSISNVTQYSYIYNLISDAIYGNNFQDEAGMVADPSTIFTYVNGQIIPRRGFPVSPYDTTTGNSLSTTNNTYARMYDKYSCRRWIGFLGEASSSIINTALIGDLVLEITLQGSEVLILGSAVGAYPIIPLNNSSIDPSNDIAGDIIAAADTAGAGNALNTKLIDFQNYTKLVRNYSQGDTGVNTAGNAITGTVGTNYTLNGAAYSTAGAPANTGTYATGMLGVGVGAITADTVVNFTLSNIYFNVVRYEFGNSDYYDALNRALDSGHIFNIMFKNYQSFTGTPTTSQAQTMRISISSQSLNWVAGMFQAPNRTTPTQPINTLIAPTQSGEVGSYQGTLDYHVQAGLPRSFNNALYFVRNGSKVGTSQWTVDSQMFPSKDLYETYNEYLRHWNIFGGKNNTLYRGCQSVYHFAETFYSDILSFEIRDDYNDGEYMVSGIDCRGQPLNILWNTAGTTNTSLYQNPAYVANSTQYTYNNKGFSYFDLGLGNGTTTINNSAGTSVVNGTQGSYQPFMVACFTSKLELSKGRNIQYYN